MTGRRGLYVAACVLAALVLSALAYVLQTKTEELIGLFRIGSFLNGNLVSGVTPKAACQVIARATLGAGGVAVLCGGAVLLSVRRAFPKGTRFIPILLAHPELALLPALVVVYRAMAEARSSVVYGRTLVGLDDDAMISLRYAWNLAHGDGLVFNVGERVEGYTNFLWTLLAAIPFAFGASAYVVPKIVLALDFCLVAATVVLMAATLRRLRCPHWAIAVAVFAYAFDANTIYFAASGLETQCLAFLVAASTYALARGASGWTFALLGVLSLTRSDAGIIALVLGAVAFAESRRRGLSTRLAPLVLALPAAHLLFRRAYYGEWLPNTYYLKVLRFEDRLTVGLGSYGFRFAAFYAVITLVAFAGISGSKRARPFAIAWVTTVMVQLAYAIWVGGDAFFYLRFIAPVLPLLYMGAGRGLGTVVRGRGLRLSPIAPMALAAFGLVITPVLDWGGRLGRTLPIESWVRSLAISSTWMSANLPPGTVSTTYPAGGVPYLTPSLRFVDLLGKTDRRIAHADHYAGLAIGHNKFDFDYVYDVRKPDVTFVDRGCWDFEAPFYMSDAERAAVRQAAPPTISPAWDVHRTHPAFLASFAQNAVHYVGDQPWVLGCSFIREGSPLPQFWSKDGPPPRATELRFVAGARNDDRIAPAGRWTFVPQAGPTADAGKIIAGAETTAVGLIDAWLALDRELTLNVCLGRPSESFAHPSSGETLLVNGIALERVPAPAKHCAIAGFRVRVPTSVLARRPSATRVQFPSQLAVESVSFRVHGED